MADARTVGALKKALADYPDDLPVVLSSDAEGNDFGNLAEVTVGRMLPSVWVNDHGARVQPNEGTPVFDGQYQYFNDVPALDAEDEDIAPSEALRALFIWPA